MKKKLIITTAIILLLAVLYHIPRPVDYHFTALDSYGFSQTIELKGTVTKFFFRDNNAQLKVLISGTHAAPFDITFTQKNFVDGFFTTSFKQDQTQITFRIDEKYSAIEYTECINDTIYKVTKS